MRTAQTRAQVAVRLPRESSWSEKRAIPELLPAAAPQSGGEASGGQLRGRKRARSQGVGGGEGRCGLQGGVSQARSDVVERQEGLDGDVLVDDGAAVEPGSLVL